MQQQVFDYKYSLDMRSIILILLTVLVINNFNILSRVEKEIKTMVQIYHQGDHSDAFAMMMKIKLAIDVLHKDLGMAEEDVKTSNATCLQLLQNIIGISQNQNLLEHFNHIEDNMNLIASKCSSSDFSNNSPRPNGFDNTCAICVVILKVMDNYALYHKRNISDFVLKEVCDLFDGALKPTCEGFIHYAGPTIISTVVNGFPADKACLSLGMCQDSACKISQEMIASLEVPPQQLTKIPSWDWIVKLFTKHFGDQHLPPFDMDNDTFSDISTFRGHHWRGADCDEFNSNIYPGRKQGNKFLDHDCNGIYGRNEKGELYENIFCDNTHRMGVAVIGDSAGAHFSIPEKYFNASLIQKGTYKDFLERVADQLDLPHESGYTGHTNTPYLSHSIYKYLRNWNLCNNNDYQNTGVNGGDSGNTWGNIKAINRNPEKDYPMLILLELVGNDVCAKSFDGMTTTAEFKRNIIRLLDWLDTTVPAGSHLWIFGLADGKILYDYLHDNIHPLNVTYQVVYDFLNCLKISPCWGWLNSNQTVRTFTNERAANLSKVYKEIIQQKKYKNFDMVYQDFPAWDIINRRILEGGDPKDMIERCDGFHPNGLFHSYLADWTWFKISTQYPEWIGPQNPHNAQIQKVFNLTVFKDGVPKLQPLLQE